MAIGQLLERLFVAIGADMSEFGAEMSRAATDTAKQTSRIKTSIESISASALNVSKKMAVIGTGLTAALTAPLLALGKSSVEAAQESAQAMAQVTASLASMGPVAGRTAEQLQKQATALMHISTFDDDEILRSVTANMLTFGNIAGAAFDRAQLAAVNLATKLKTDLQSATLLVGKAINDPVKGMAALGRAGIQFTETQKDTIKALVETGQAAKAQDIILKELEKQFAGSAAAMRAATPGAEIKNNWDDLKETLGQLALDILPKIIPPINAILAGFNNLSPGMQQVIGVAAVLAAAFGPVLIGISGVIAALATIGPPLAAAVIAFSTFSTGLLTAVIPALGSLVVALAPILVPLAAIAAAVAAVYYAWKNWDLIEPILAKAWDAVKTNVTDGIGRALDIGKQAVSIFLKVHVDAFNMIVTVAQSLYTGVKTWLMDKLGVIFDWVGRKIEAVKGFFFGLYDAVVGHSYVPDMVDGIAEHFARLEGVMVRPSEAAMEDVKRIFMEGAAEVERITERLGQAAPLVAERFAPTQAGPIDFSNIDDMVRAVEDDLEKPIISSTERIANGFARMTEDVTYSIDSLVSSIKHGDVVGIITGVANTISSIIGAIGAIKSGFKIGAPTISAAPRAAGGSVRPYGQYLVGEHGPEILRMGADGGSVSNNGEMQSILSNGGRYAQPVEVKIAVDANPYFDARVVKVVRPGLVAAAQQGAIGGHAISTGEARRKASRRIPG